MDMIWYIYVHSKAAQEGQFNLVHGTQKKN